MTFPSVKVATLDDLLAREEITDVVKRLARATDRMDEALIAANARDSPGQFVPQRRMTVHQVGRIDASQLDTQHHLPRRSGPR